MTSAGKQIGGELDALEAEVQPLGERADGERLRQAGDAFEQHVPAGQQAEDEPIEKFALPDDDAADLRVKRIEPGAHGLHLPIAFVESVQAVRHCAISQAHRRAREPAGLIVPFQPDCIIRTCGHALAQGVEDGFPANEEQRSHSMGQAMTDPLQTESSPRNFARCASTNIRTRTTMMRSRTSLTTMSARG